MKKYALLVVFFAISEAMICEYYTSDIYTCSEFVLEKGRPLEIPKKLSYANLSLTDFTGGIDKETFTLLPETESLIFAYSNITEIESGAFCKTLPKLQRITITGNENVVKLTAAKFENCEKIKEFSYHRRGNQRDASEIMEPLLITSSFPNVEKIEISNVIFKHLKKEHFSGLNNLKTVKIFSSTIENSESGVFSSNPKLENLELEGTISVQGNIFQGCESVKNLLFSTESQIHENTFQGLKNLNNLKIDYGLKVINENFFKGLKELKKFTMYYTTIETIPPKTFQDLTNLNELKIENCKIKTISPEIFEPLKSLTVLTIQETPIDTIESIKNLPSLTTLDVSQNMIRHVNVSEVKKNLPKLKSFAIYSVDSLISCEDIMIMKKEFGEVKLLHSFDDDDENCTREKQWREINGQV